MPKHADHAKPPEAEAEDPANAKLVANARKVADELSAATNEALEQQAQHEKVIERMQQAAAKTRQQAEEQFTRQKKG